MRKPTKAKDAPLRRQRRIPGMRREPCNSVVLPVIERKIEDLAARHHATKSMVRAVLLAQVLGVEHETF